MLTKGSENGAINNVNDSWFENTNQTFINSTFKYPLAKRVNIAKPVGKIGTWFFSITNSRINITEKNSIN